MGIISSLSGKIQPLKVNKVTINFNLAKLFYFVFFLSHSSAYSQSFVKKDSSEIIPFISKIFYQTDLDTSIRTPDRLFYNHRIQSVGMANNFSGLTGTLGSSLVPVLYENIFYQNIKLGRSLNDPYFYSSENIPYFALNKPISELDFTFFGNGNEEFKGFLSQNISRTLNLGIGIRRTNNKGFFLMTKNRMMYRRRLQEELTASQASSFGSAFNPLDETKCEVGCVWNAN